MRRAGLGLALLLAALTAGPRAFADVTSQQVERAIARGIAFLKSQRQPDGSWTGEQGITALATLALITAGEAPDSPEIDRSLQWLVRMETLPQHETYTLGLKAMAVATNPAKYSRALDAYASRLRESQIRTNHRLYSGGWTYSKMPGGFGQGDNSNAQYAILGLYAASEAGIRVDRSAFLHARRYWENAQCRDGGWAYHSGVGAGATGSMTCAGISSLIMTGSKHTDSIERMVGDRVEHCGERTYDPNLQAGLDWLALHFDVRNNILSGIQWKYYYLYGLERAGRLSGLRYFGRHDWYREGAQELVSLQDPVQGFWRGMGNEGNPVVATSFSLLFLAKGRSPVLINKLKHGPGRDWNNDPEDVANLTSLVSRDWKHLVTWQYVDPAHASVEDLLQAPIAYISGHERPVFSDEAKETLRGFVDNGGLILAEACCRRAEFDQGFRALLKEVFPEPESELHPLPPEHPVWRAKHIIDADSHPLWGIERGCRTVVIYSPDDLSCSWQQMETAPGNPRVGLGSRVGQNIVDYATGRELPADKLAAREMGKIGVDVPKRGALQIGKIRHGGDWNIAPLAIPNLTSTLREKLKFDVVINHKELAAEDPNLVNFPLLYIHGRGALSFTDEQKISLRRHLSPGGGTLFADAACGSTAFDTAFRKCVAELYPDRTLEAIPPTDDFFTRQIGFNLEDCQLNKAAGGAKGFPTLEGVRIDGHWAIIYSKFDLGCALERHAGIDCKGYNHESALRIASNIVIYATIP
jgi:hypothetical protein